MVEGILNSKEDYVESIRQMCGGRGHATAVFTPMKKRDVIIIHNLIEGARYKAIDEYKKQMKKNTKEV